MRKKHFHTVDPSLSTVNTEDSLIYLGTFILVSQDLSQLHTYKGNIQQTEEGFMVLSSFLLYIYYLPVPNLFQRKNVLFTC